MRSSTTGAAASFSTCSIGWRPPEDARAYRDGGRPRRRAAVHSAVIGPGGRGRLGLSCMPRRFASLGFVLLLLSQSPLAAQERLTVVELFTSQGCSSCPAADAFLGELAKRPDVLALSEHIDYWDYLGWKDPFASRENTERQRAYARRLGSGYVYTPQMVVQGMGQIAGADREGVLELVARAKDLPLVPVDVKRTGEDAMVARLGPATLPAAVDV